MNIHLRTRAMPAIAFVTSAAFLAGIGISSAHAQSGQATSGAPSPQTVMVADVELQNCSVSAQTGHSITVSCGIINKMAARPDIKYSVALVDASGVMQAQYVFPDSISVNQDQSINKSMVYNAPAYLSGSYTVWVALDTSDSLPLDRQPVGTVTLSATSNNYVVMSPPSCYVSVAGDSKKYTLTQGVDFDSTDSVTVTCSAQNLSSATAITATPSFETHLRTLVGPVVTDTHDSQSAITFSGGAKKTVTITLPKALTPQSYDTLLTLKAADGSIVSNTIRIHYVLRGASATIQLLSLDKNSYAAGDTAQVQLWWTGSADTFEGSRKPATNDNAKTVELSLVDGTGNSCAAPIDSSVPTDAASKPASFQMSVTKDCANPSVTAKIIDTAGNVLVQKSISLTGPLASSTPAAAKKSTNSVWFFLLGLLVLLILIGVVMKRNKDRRMKLGAMIFLIAAAFPVHHANAATFVRTWDRYGNGRDIVTVTFTAALDQSTYSPRSPLTVSGTIVSSYCSNGVPFDVRIFGTNSADSVEMELTNGPSSQGTTYQSSALTAPAASGNYFVGISTIIYDDFNGGKGSSDEQTAGQLPYTVALANCLATTVNDCSLPTTPSGGSAGSCDSTTTGNCNYACNNGTWTVNSNSCKPNCTATTIGDCSLPATPSGGSAGSCDSTTTGNCNYACNNGTWTVNSNSCTIPPSCILNVSKTDINSGDSDTLTWVCKHASSCTEYANSDGFSTGGKTSGSDSSVTPTPSTNGTATYDMTCDGQPIPPFPTITIHSPAVNITANPLRVVVGNQTNVSWTSNDTTSCAVTKNGNAWNTGLNNVGVKDTVTAQSTYAITCHTTYGGDVTSSVIVNVGPAFQEF